MKRVCAEVTGELSASQLMTARCFRSRSSHRDIISALATSLVAQRHHRAPGEAGRLPFSSGDGNVGADDASASSPLRALAKKPELPSA